MLGIELTLTPDARPVFSGGLTDASRGLTDAGPALTGGDVPFRLMAKLVQRGRKGWAGRSLSWAGLDSRYGPDGRPNPQVQLLQEMYAVYRARSGQPAPATATVTGSRSTCPPSSPPALAAAGRGRRTRPVACARARSARWTATSTAEFCLDLTRAGQGGPLGDHPGDPHRTAPRRRSPIRFIGTEGHGLVYADHAEAERSSDLPRLAVRAGQAGQAGAAAVAADGAGRGSGWSPGRGAAPVPGGATTRGSGGGHGPVLRRLVHAARDHRPGAAAPRRITAVVHDLDVSWDWAYQVGESPMRVPLQALPRRPGTGIWPPSGRSWPAWACPLGRFGLLRTDPVSDEPQPSLRPRSPAERH